MSRDNVAFSQEPVQPPFHTKGCAILTTSELQLPRAPRLYSVCLLIPMHISFIVITIAARIWKEIA